MCAAKYGISDATFYNWRFALWRDGGLRCPQAERAGGREPPTEEAARRDDADASTLKEMLGKKSDTRLAEACCDLGDPREELLAAASLWARRPAYATKRLAMKSFAGGCESLPHNGDGLAIVALV
jgi:transposase-like protein